MSQNEDDYKQELSVSDASFIRVLEDLIDALVANGVLRMTDLPHQALAKVNERTRTRHRLRGSLDVINDDEPLI